MQVLPGYKHAKHNLPLIATVQVEAQPFYIRTREGQLHNLRKTFRHHLPKGVNLETAVTMKSGRVSVVYQDKRLHGMHGKGG